MCTERSPPPLHSASAQTAPRFLFGAPSAMGHHERKGGWRKRGRATCNRGQRQRFANKGERLLSGRHRHCAKEAAQCKRLAHAQTTWHLAVDAVNSLRKDRLHRARGEGEGEGNVTRSRVGARISSVSVKSLHRFTLYLQPSCNQHIAKQKW